MPSPLAAQAVVLRVVHTDLTILPNLHSHFVVFEPQSPSSSLSPSHAHDHFHPFSAPVPAQPSKRTTANAEPHLKHQPVEWIRHDQNCEHVTGASSQSSQISAIIQSPAELSTAIQMLRPSRVYVLLPSQPVESLTPGDIAPLLDVEEALRHARICEPASATLSSVNSNSTVRVSASPGFKTSLLFDTVLPARDVQKYKTLFQSQETLAGHSAASVLLSRIDGTSPASTGARWSGSLMLPTLASQDQGQGQEKARGQDLSTGNVIANRERIHANTVSKVKPSDIEPSSFNVLEFPGLHLISSPTAGANHMPSQLLTRGASQARILAFAPSMPDVAAFHMARSGLQLRLAQSCPHQTAKLFNELALSGDGMLLGIGDARFWCFWTPKTASSESPTCHALYLSPLHRYAAGALDTAAWALRMGVGVWIDDSNETEEDEEERGLAVRELPHGLSSLPVKNFFSSASPPLFDQLYDMDCLSLQEAIQRLCPPPKESNVTNNMKEPANTRSEVIDVDNPNPKVNKHNDKREPEHIVNADAPTAVGFTPLLDFDDEVSGPELQLLDRRERDRERDSLGTMGGTTTAKFTGPPTRSDSCSVLDSRSLTGTGRKSSASGRETQRAYRQLRFQRLMNTNSRQQQQQKVDKRGADAASGGSVQRVKRARTSDVNANVDVDVVGGGGGVNANGIRRRNSKGVVTGQRQSSSLSISMLQAIRTSLHTLKTKDPFFPRTCALFDGENENENNLNRDNSNDNDNDNESSKKAPNFSTLGERLTLPEFDDDAVGYEFTRDWLGHAHSLQGNHGVEYLFDGDGRDKYITEYEGYVSQTGQEFRGRDGRSNDGTRITRALKALRCEKVDCRQHEQEHGQEEERLQQRERERNINNERRLLRQIAEGIRCGTVVVKDIDLRMRLLQATNVSSMNPS